MLYYRLQLHLPLARKAYFDAAWKLWIAAYNEIGDGLTGQLALFLPSSPYHTYRMFNASAPYLPRLAVRTIALQAYFAWRDLEFHELVPPENFKLHKDLLWLPRKAPNSIVRNVTMRLMNEEKITFPMRPVGLGRPQWAFFDRFPLVGARWNTSELQLYFKLPHTMLPGYEQLNYRLNPDCIVATARSPKGMRELAL